MGGMIMGTSGSVKPSPIFRRATTGRLWSNQSAGLVAGAEDAGGGAGSSQADCRVIIVGSANVDLTAHVSGRIGEARIQLGLPGSPRVLPGGRGLNQAVACAHLGMHTHFIALMGDDLFADHLEQFWTRCTTTRRAGSKGT